MKNKVMVALACGILFVGGSALAQNANDLQQQSNSAAMNQGVSNSTVINNTAPSDVHTSTDFRTNQASSAPAVIGSAASSSGGCPVIEGSSAGIAIINGGYSSARELPGCMANQLADRVDSLRKNPDGSWTGPSLIKLEAWCNFPQYKLALENSGQYTCRATRDEQQLKQFSATVLAPPQQPQYTDPIVRARMGLAPLK